MTKYLIKLKPLDTFFFSQDTKYRTKKDKGEEADYFQRSAYFPQQTALLGTLRYFLLLKNGQIPITDKRKAEGLIGESSFQVQATEQKFGKIGKVSPVFILDKDENIFIRNPKDVLLKKGDKPEEFYQENLILNATPIKTNFGDIKCFDNYDEKQGLSSFLYNSDSKWLFMDFVQGSKPDGVFIEQEKIGITKNVRENDCERKPAKSSDRKEGFFKQIVFKLNEGYSFGLIAELDDDLHGYDSYVGLGTEKGPFKISFTKWEKGELEGELSIKNSDLKKLVLLSDAYLPDYDKNQHLFAISSTKPFRCLTTTVETGHSHYSQDPTDRNGGMTRSGRFNLFDAGSVFYFKDQAQLLEFETKLKEQNNFTRIGYNHFKTIK